MLRFCFLSIFISFLSIVYKNHYILVIFISSLNSFKMLPLATQPTLCSFKSFKTNFVCLLKSISVRLDSFSSSIFPHGWVSWGTANCPEISAIPGGTPFSSHLSICLHQFCGHGSIQVRLLYCTHFFCSLSPLEHPPPLHWAAAIPVGSPLSLCLHSSDMRI